MLKKVMKKKKIFVLTQISIVVKSEWKVSTIHYMTTTTLFSMKVVTLYQIVLKTLTGIYSLKLMKFLVLS